MKDPLVRFSVAIGGELLRRFDKYREMHRYPNRSEAVRGLMRDALVEETIARDDSDAMGVVTLIYDHHVSRIARRLTDLQHPFISTRRAVWKSSYFAARRSKSATWPTT
jgi:CopG family nickel-responsive transcriptional regulator